ncbi:MAG: hypothetical protein KJN93_09485 [Alphaproteobacteria bacterium]|nr:hypothetical protein [Alphaproteobacteria bacterium]
MLEILVSDTIRYGHLLAVAVGFGVSFHTEVHAARQRNTRIDQGFLDDMALRHRLILGSVIAMWVTGLAIMAIRTGFRIDAFSAKLWTKLAVVSILTANAMLIGRIALPILRRSEGRSIAEIGLLRQVPLFAVAGISSVSWLIALALGSSLFLKTAPATLFLTVLPYAYGIGITAAVIAGLALIHRDRASSAAEAEPRVAAPVHTEHSAPHDPAAADPAPQTAHDGVQPRRTRAQALAPEIAEMTDVLAVLNDTAPLPHRTKLPHRQQNAPAHLRPKSTLRQEAQAPANAPSKPIAAKPPVRRATEQRLRAAFVG